MDPDDVSYSFRFESAETAALGVEGYDAHDLDYFGGDGTVYRATVGPPRWGPVTLHPTTETRLDDLIGRLRRLAEWHEMVLPSDLPSDPGRIWDYIGAHKRPMRS